MKKAENEAVSVTLPGPARLAKWFAMSGFDVSITFTRNGVLSDDAPDPGADPGCIDDPITPHDLADIRGLLAAYEVQDKEPTGPRGVIGPKSKR